MAKVNKSDLIERIQEKTGGTKADAERAINAVIDTVVDTLSDAKEVSISGLGIFKSRIRKARKARNPRTGEAIDVPRMRVPKFRPAKALKEAVRNQHLDEEE